MTLNTLDKININRRNLNICESFIFKKSVKNSLKVKKQGNKDKALNFCFRLKRKAMETLKKKNSKIEVLKCIDLTFQKSFLNIYDKSIKGKNNRAALGIL